MAENREYITYSEDKGSINISEEVVAAIAAGAALETDGVAALYNSPARDFAEIMGKRGVSRGARIKVEEEAIVADIFVVAKSGTVLADMGKRVQGAVKAAVEATTGITVSTVNIHVCSVAPSEK